MTIAKINTHLTVSIMTMVLQSVHAERKITNVPERPHFVEKRVNQVPRLQQRTETTPVVKYANILFSFIDRLTLFTNYRDVIYKFYCFSARLLVAQKRRTTSALWDHAYAGLVARHAQALRHSVSTPPLLELLKLLENCQPSKI